MYSVYNIDLMRRSVSFEMVSFFDVKRFAVTATLQ
jgi:hypothetical protein